VLVDAHVHFHGVYDVDRFFDGAVDNFRDAARELGLGADTPGVLMLTESAGDDAFGRWASGEHGRSWELEPTVEPRSLVARRHDGAGVTVVAGRQVQVAEGVEVLVLGTLERPADGAPARSLLAELRGGAAVPVVPWGFGKWWRRRGRFVRELFEGEEELLLADTGGRPRLSSYPALLGHARSGSRPVLAGSDPLPFRRDERRAGSFGFELPAAFDPARPAASIVTALGALSETPRRYGRLAGLGAFCRDQLAMQWRKRGPGGTP
jgi:hypothetical protein